MSTLARRAVAAILVSVAGLSLTFPVLAQQLAPGIQLVDRITALKRPWGAAFLPDGRLLVSEFEGTVRLFDESFHALSALAPPDDLDQRRLAQFDNTGAFDVAVDPAFAENGAIYYSYAAAEEDGAYLKVVRIVLEGDAFGTPSTIWSAPPASSDRFHYGGALEFAKDGTLLVAAGERFSSAAAQGDRFPAQEVSDPRGKIWALTGVATSSMSDIAAGARMMAMGTRNVQGIGVDPEGAVWFVDHGPIRGDEINRLVPGGNFGWPYRTSGTYKPAEPSFSAEPPVGMSFVEPAFTWLENTVAPSAIAFYGGSGFTEWRGSWLISGLSSGRLLRMWREADSWSQVQLLLGVRLRDVVVSAKGRVFVLTDEPAGRVVEIVPAIPTESSTQD